MNSTVVIHLSKIDHNLDAIDRRLKSGVQIMAVIKDNAYGHGITPIAKHIKDRVEWFCVARVNEGKQLREAGVRNPILVFEAPRNETSNFYTKFDLTATVSEIDSLKILKAGTKYHINFDTGMHRLGVLPIDLSDLKYEMKNCPELICTGIYTHFYKANDPGNPEVEEQLEIFKKIRVEFPSELMTHTANTGGVFHYSELDLQFDAVRPGVCLYGYGAGSVEVSDLKPVLDWKSFLMQVKRVKKGSSVSYGGKWVAPEDGFIGVIPSGYSDGIPRALTNSIQVMIANKLYDQVGVISMDYSVVYLQNDEYESGEEVFLLKGNELSAKKWAQLNGTIPYEITTSIKERVRREFI